MRDQNEAMADALDNAVALMERLDDLNRDFGTSVGDCGEVVSARQTWHGNGVCDCREVPF